MEKQDCFLTRNETNFIKAVAIIMMLIHHFWGFPAWRVGGAALEPAIYLPGGASLSWMAARQFKICVAMFAVITGYGWGKGQVSLRKAAQRIGKVLLAYEWCLAAEYILNELAAPGSVSLRDLPDQITLCFFHGELLIRFAWYVRFFILAAFSYLAFVRLMRACPNRLVQGLIAVAPFWAVYYCLSRWAAPWLQYGDVPDYLTYMPCIMIGTWIADSRYPVRKRRKVSAAASLFWVAVCAALLYARYYASSRAYLDVFLAPCLIYALSNLYAACGLARLQKCFDLLAARGIYMWLLHSLFFLTPGAAQFQNILYLSKSPLLVFLWGFLIVFLAACLLRFLAETVSRWVSHLNRKSLPK